MKRNRFMLTLMAVLVLAIFTACSGEGAESSDASGSTDESSDEGEEETKTIEFMTISLSPTFDDYINDVIANFEEENPGVEVEWSDEPIDHVEQVVLTQGASGNLPDVMNLNTLFVKKIGGLGGLVNLDEAASDVKDDYFEGLWQSGGVNGNTYAFPWYVTTDAVLYNPEILEEAGIDEVPRTFEESLEIADTIMEETGAYSYPMNISQQKLLPLYGINIIDEDATEATFNTSETERIWTFFKEKYDEGLLPTDVITGQTEISELYAQEKATFWYTGPQKFREVEELNSEVYDKSDVAPAFVTEENIDRAAIMNVAVAEQSDHKDAAVEFGKYLTNKENQLEFAKASNTLPSVIAAAEDEYFEVDESLEDPGEKGNNIAAQTLDIAIDTTISTENASEITTAINDAFHTVLFDDKDPKEALNDAEEEINGLLDELE